MKPFSICNCILPALCSLAFSLSAQEMYYVSPVAGEEGNGKVTSPFCRIEQALEAVRTSSAQETVIYLRGGTYRLDQPLALTPEQVPAGKRLTIKSFPGERAVLSGGRVLKLEWTPYKRKIMKARVTDAMSVDMLLVDVGLRPMARYPNYDSTAVRLNGTSADATAPDRVRKWKHPEEGYLHAMHGSDWGSLHYRITGKDTLSWKVDGRTTVSRLHIPGIGW